jgi:3',5'-nucleoside bisphosphate phosphatase
VAEAFDRYLSAGRPAYVPAPSVPLADPVALASKAGGVAVLAHPGRLPPTNATGSSRRHWRPASTGSRCGIPNTTQRCATPMPTWSGRRGLVATGGSDYHGHHKPNVHLGTPAVPAQVLDTLRDRLATDGPLCVGFAQNGAKQPKGGTT